MDKARTWMKILADENIPVSIVKALREDGNDVSEARLVCGGCTDDQIIDLANREHRILLTQDRDFGELAIRWQISVPGIIKLDMPEASNALKARRLIAALRQNTNFHGYLTVIESNRLRQRRLQ